MVVPDLEEVAKWAAGQGIAAADPAGVVSGAHAAKLKAAVQAEMNAACKAAKLQAHAAS